ncbi:MAG TPA: sulfite exporter TauE/SafE family protein [Microbacteriaceae bacterium]|nr:sulfite exporter TauE/SafE family protein [Microbacteriaceae bacterium]
MSRLGWRRAVALALVGLGAGYLSGLFGIGGGIIIVPLLVLLGFDIKKASAISLGAVLIISSVGVASYASFGEVNWFLAALLALGSVVGAQLGSRVLGRLPARTIQFAFAFFLLAVAMSLFFAPVARDAVVHIGVASAIAAVLLGLVVGTLASILGIGGGVMIVPALILGFGAGDLLARGTAIAMMVPTAISGTIAHVRAGRADLLASALIGAGALGTTALGAVTAHLLEPRVGNVLFGALLVFLAGQLAWRARRATK